jgi:hypothetical protein
MKLSGLVIQSVASIGLLALSTATNAGVIKCDVDAPNLKNYMEVPDTQASACLGAGVGTLSGNPSGGNADEFLASAAGAGYATASKSDGTNPFGLAYDKPLETWSFNASAWSIHPAGTKLVLGFKWGTGSTPDEYFLFQLIPGVSSGSYDWFPIAVKGIGAGGLSHMILYSTRCVAGTPGCEPPDRDRVSEPGSAALLGLGLLGIAGFRRNLKKRLGAS